jgi:hypothetical protein
LIASVLTTFFRNFLKLLTSTRACTKYAARGGQRIVTLKFPLNLCRSGWILYQPAGNWILYKIQGIPKNSQKHHKTVTKIFSEPKSNFSFPPSTKKIISPTKKVSDFPISQKT